MKREIGRLIGSFVLLLAAFVPVKAESVTYSFFGSAWLTGTSFTYISPTGFLSFDTGPLVPTTASDVFFYDISGAYFKNDIGKLANFDFVSEDELLLHTTTNCTLDFTLSGGYSHVHSVCPSGTLTAGSSVLGFGYLLNVYTNFDVVGTGEIGIASTVTASPAPEPSSLLVLGLGFVGAAVLLRRRNQVEK